MHLAATLAREASVPLALRRQFPLAINVIRATESALRRCNPKLPAVVTASACGPLVVIRCLHRILVSNALF